MWMLSRWRVNVRGNGINATRHAAITHDRAARIKASEFGVVAVDVESCARIALTSPCTGMRSSIRREGSSFHAPQARSFDRSGGA